MPAISICIRSIGVFRRAALDDLDEDDLVLLLCLCVAWNDEDADDEDAADGVCHGVWSSTPFPSVIINKRRCDGVKFDGNSVEDVADTSCCRRCRAIFFSGDGENGPYKLPYLSGATVAAPAAPARARAAAADDDDGDNDDVAMPYSSR